MMICQAACAASCAGARRGDGAVGVDVEIGDGLERRRLPAACMARNSRHIFQQTQSSSRPPASSRPMICKQLRGDAGEADAHQRGRADADQDRLARCCRQARGGQPDDDRVVAGEHQVDHDDFEKCRQCVSGEEFQHGGLRLLRGDARRARADPCRSKRASDTAGPCDAFDYGNQRAMRVVVKVPRGATPTGESSPTSQPARTARGARPGRLDRPELSSITWRRYSCRPAGSSTDTIWGRRGAVLTISGSWRAAPRLDADCAGARDGDARCRVIGRAGPRGGRG